MMNEEELIKNAGRIWDMYEKAKEYQNSSGLSKIIPECVKFVEGNQWAKATDRTKTLPRPVINIIRMICRSKKAGILSNKTSFVYSCEDPEKSDKFTRFSNYICKEIGQEKLDRKAVDDGVKKGTYIYHYYWDADAIGKKGNINGGVRAEIIDPLNFFPENSNNDDEQNQKWIIIRSRLNVDTVKAMCDEGINKDLISSDDNESKYQEEEQDPNNKCTVLTRYFKKNGEVYFEKSVRGTMINSARALHPNIENARKIINGEDPANEQGYELANNKQGRRIIARYYPIAVGNYETKDKSIFGIGEVEGIIPNQKAINLNLAIQLLNIQNVWGGKYLVHPNALRNQKITNDPGQVLIDYSQTMTGIKKITEQVQSDIPVKTLDVTMNATRVVTGATEVMTGETIGANTSGAAILQLQSQALKPIEELQQAFWDTKVKCGKILEMFYKLFYENEDYYYSPVNENGVEEKVRKLDTFNGSEFLNTDFEVTVNVISGAKGSEVSLVNSLDNLLQSKQIDIYTYFKLYPQNALPNKNQIIDVLKKRENDEMFELKSQLEQYKSQLENAAKLFEQSKDTIQNAVNVMKENESLKEFIINLKAEYSKKIEDANMQINLSNEKINETTADARKLAEQLYNFTQGNKGN